MFDTNNRNDQPQAMSEAAFDAAINEAKEQSAGKRIEAVPEGDLLPAPKFAGQVIVHPASLKKYVAEQEERGLIWSISPDERETK
jgi:hypothetical protein